MSVKFIFIMALVLMTSQTAFALGLKCELNGKKFSTQDSFLKIGKVVVEGNEGYCYGCIQYWIDVKNSSGEVLATSTTLLGEDVGYRNNNDPAALNILVKTEEGLLKCAYGIGKHAPLIYRRTKI